MRLFFVFMSAGQTHSPKTRIPCPECRRMAVQQARATTFLISQCFRRAPVEVQGELTARGSVDCVLAQTPLSFICRPTYRDAYRPRMEGAVWCHLLLDCSFSLSLSLAMSFVINIFLPHAAAITEWQGDTDMTTLVLDMGSAMEQFDMGDAFVGAWDIANLVSDFLMEKMGAETSGCSAKAPKTLPSAWCVPVWFHCSVVQYCAVRIVSRIS